MGGSKTKRRRVARVVLVTALAMFLAAGLAVVGYVHNLANTFEENVQTLDMDLSDDGLMPSGEVDIAGVAPVDQGGDESTGEDVAQARLGQQGGEEPQAAAPDSSGPQAMNILVIGSDARGSSVDQPVQQTLAGSRSDTLMLVHVPADRENVYVMSIMRDLWVDIPGHGTQKINAALAFGGVPLVVNTVEGLFDEQIDHVAVMNFSGYRALTTALGGVTVDVPYTFSSAGYDFHAGEMTIKGDQALAFVRERKQFSNGDYQRVENQQIVMKAVLSKLMSVETLTNPFRLHEVVSQFSPYLSVDAGLDAGTVASMAVSMRDIRGDDVETFTLPTNGTGTSADGQSIVLPDFAAIAQISAALDNGTIGQYLQVNGL